MTTEAQSTLELEALQEAQRQAQIDLRMQLKRFHWASLPCKNDPDSEAFWSDPKAAATARAYQHITSRLYYLRHTTECINSNHKYRKDHQQEIHETYLKYFKAHPNIYNEHYKNHRNEVLAQSAAYYRDHRDIVLARTALWQRNHPDSVRASNSRRRARLANADGDFTEAEFRALCSEQDNRCSYCGEMEDLIGILVPDHMTPISRDGSNNIDNITPACKHCNSSKGDKTVEEFLDYLEHLSNKGYINESR